MNKIHNKITTKGASFAQQYMLQKGLKVFHKKGKQAAIKELDQLLWHACFTPMSVHDLTPSEHKKAQQALMFLTVLWLNLKIWLISFFFVSTMADTLEVICQSQWVYQ